MARRYCGTATISIAHKRGSPAFDVKVATSFGYYLFTLTDDDPWVQEASPDALDFVAARALDHAERLDELARSGRADHVGIDLNRSARVVTFSDGWDWAITRKPLDAVD